MRRSCSVARFPYLALAGAVTLAVTAVCSTVQAQPVRAAPAVRAPVDSLSQVCLDVTWLDAKAICEGRTANAAALVLLGGLSGAMAGYVGGAIVPTACLGNGESAAARGAVAGAAIGLAGGLFLRHVSRRSLAARNAAARENARRAPTRPWSWRDVRPAAVAVGGAALAGAAIGAARGAQSRSCADGARVNALRGAGVYGSGALATIGGTLLAVRLFF
jgi:hypothetical protein